MKVNITFYRRGSNGEMDNNSNNGESNGRSENINGNSENGQTSNSNDQGVNGVALSISLLKPLVYPIVSSIMVSVLVAICSSVINAKIILPMQVEHINESIDNLENAINANISNVADTINTRIDGIENTMNEKFDDIDDSFDEIHESIDGLDTRLRSVENAYSAHTGRILASSKTSFAPYTITPEGLKVMNASYQVETVVSGVGLNCSADTKIAKDPSTGKKKTAKSLIETGIVLSYVEDEKEVYFLGLLNKNYHWNGQCLINVYEGNNLIQITEATYDDGKLKGYRQVFEYEEKNIWIVSKREHKKVKVGTSGYKWVNAGTSTSYYKEDNKPEYYIKSFSMDSVKGSNILAVDDFIKSYCVTQEGFYSGNTENGLFNDNSEEAYLVKYNRDGRVRLFYRGRMKDGKQLDKTGNAWDIVLGEDNKYYYRRAHYSKKGIVYRTVTEKSMAMTVKQTKKKFKEKIGNIEVKCKLRWHE